jgi:hypothetical protein
LWRRWFGKQTTSRTTLAVGTVVGPTA